VHILSLLSLPHETSSAFFPDPDDLIMLGKGKIGNMMCNQSSVKLGDSEDPHSSTGLMSVLLHQH